MSKIQKSNHTFIPPTDWEKEIWGKENYQKHEREFQTILVEYRELRRKFNDSAIMARWKWLESKYAVRLKIYDRFYEPLIRTDRYEQYSNMFSRFSEWCQLNEVRDGLKAEGYQEMLNKKNKADGDFDRFVEEATLNF